MIARQYIWENQFEKNFFLWVFLIGQWNQFSVELLQLLSNGNCYYLQNMNSRAKNGSSKNNNNSNQEMYIDPK